jgi:hypothetical protein
MSLHINVNSIELTRYSNRLNTIRETLLPKAVRNTLNDVAFNTKRRVPEVAQQTFKIRNRSLFRAFIFVNKSVTGNIDSMQAEVGIFNNNEKTAEGLAKQEIGGVADRGLIPMDTARVSGSNDKKVRSANYLQKITLPTGRSRGTGTGHILIQKNGKGTLFQTKNGRRNQRLKPLYSFMRNRKVQIRRKGFIKHSAEIEGLRMNEIFIRNANFLISRMR